VTAGAAALADARPAGAAPPLRPGELALSQLSRETFIRLGEAERAEARWVLYSGVLQGAAVISAQGNGDLRLGAEFIRRFTALLGNDRVYAVKNWADYGKTPPDPTGAAPVRVYTLTFVPDLSRTREPKPISVDILPDRRELVVRWIRTPPAPSAPVSRVTTGRLDAVSKPLLALLREAFPDDAFVRELRFPPARTAAEAAQSLMSTLPGEVVLKLASVRPGMTRAALNRFFQTEGGLSTRFQRHYIVGASRPPEMVVAGPDGGQRMVSAPLVKAAVEFAAPGQRIVWVDGIGYPLEIQTRELGYREQPDDVILNVRPYLGYRAID
jgi:hypothetical protein